MNIDIKFDMERDNDEKEEKKEKEEKTFLILHSREIQKEEIELLKEYGNVFSYESCYANLSIDEIIQSKKIRYFLFNLNEKTHRTILTKELRNQYPVVVMICWYEWMDDFIKDIKESSKNMILLRNFPEKQAIRDNFEFYLENEEISEPSCSRTIANFCSHFDRIWNFIFVRIRGCLIQQVGTLIGCPPNVLAALDLIT